MKKILTVIVALCAMAVAANAANYSIDESAIDAAIENAVEVSPLDAVAMAGGSPISTADIKIGNGVEPVLAFIFALIPITSWVALHRMYMGTSVLAIILNVVTGAGFGIVWAVDWIVLLLDGVIGKGNIKKYCNNPRWWMWADII